MKADCHILAFPMHEAPKQGEDYPAKCGKKIIGAMWVWTSGDVPDFSELVKQFGMTCSECVAAMSGGEVLPVSFAELTESVQGELPERLRIYGAVSRDVYDDLVKRRRIAV